MKLPQSVIKVGILGMGACIGPFIMLVATPFLTRIYSPADFGYLALFTSITSVFIVISCLRYEGAIQIVDDENFGLIVRFALVAVLIVLVVEALILSTGLPQMRFESLINLGSDVKFLPIVSAAGGILLVVTNVTLRHGRYFRNALSRSITTIIFIAIALVFPLFGLVYASIAASILTGTIALVYLLLTVKFGPIDQTFILAKKYIKYPLLLAPTALIDTVALALPILFMSGSYGVDAVGNYTQIQKLLGAPIILLGVVAAQLFSKQSGELFRLGQSSKKLLWKTVSLLTIASLITLLITVVFGQFLCQKILGQGWRVDTLFIVLAVVPCLVRTVISPISFIFLAYQKIKYLVIWQACYFLISYIVLYYAAATMQLEDFIVTYIIGDTIMYLLYLMLANNVSNLQNNPSKL